MLIAISKYTKPLAEVDKHRADHIEHVKPYFADGSLLVGGRQIPPNGGVIISKNLTRAQFEALLATDPYVKAQVAEYEIIEFNPAMKSQQF